MDMNGIKAASSSSDPSYVDGIRRDGRRPAAEEKDTFARSDRIELSDEARRLVGESEEFQSARKLVLDAARQKLLDGSLINSESIRRAAENLLRSGDLDTLDE